jgi:hypothetical protein
MAGGLSHVRWIGGGSGAGKSTVAAALANRYGLALHHAEPPSRFLPRTTPATAPRLHAFAGMSMDERWVSRSPQEMYDTFHAFHGECFDLLVAELADLSRDKPVLVEGFSLLPRLVTPLLRSRTDAIWLLPTPAFRRCAFEARGSTWTIPSRTSDPERALENLLARDAIFTDHLRHEVELVDAQSLDVDGTLGLPETINRVAAALELSG